MRVTVAWIILCLPAIAEAQVATSDFARGAEIHAEGASLFRVALPDEVYQTSTRPDLADLRVLNASGQPVPHTLREAPGPASEDAEWRTVPSFPMTDVQGGGTARAQVRVDARGAVLEVTNGTDRRLTTAYLVDASGVDQPATRIALTWQAAPEVTFLARVSVQGSDDLNIWRTLVPSAAIAQLQRESYTLTQSEIELPAVGRMKYLRISWPKELAAVTLTTVRVLPRASERQEETRWKTFDSERLERGGAALYDTHGMFPAQYVDVEFVNAADVASIRVQSRATNESDWRLRYSGLFYALREPDGVLRSNTARISRVSDRYWRLDGGRGSDWTSKTAPRLKLGWHPHEIVFVARGPAPYMLVYGSGRVSASEAPVDALLASLSESDLSSRVGQATLGEPHDLGGAGALSAAPPYRRLALWGILVAAVIALAVVAIRTFREANAASS